MEEDADAVKALAARVESATARAAEDVAPAKSAMEAKDVVAVAEAVRDVEAESIRAAEDVLAVTRVERDAEEAAAAAEGIRDAVARDADVVAAEAVAAVCVVVCLVPVPVLALTAAEVEAEAQHLQEFAGAVLATAPCPRFAERDKNEIKSTRFKI
jgi:hypothetical protein